MFAKHYSRHKVTLPDIDVGPINYSLKCVVGAYKHMHFYISLAPEGEIVGSVPKDKEK
jgi:hypothetical protein